ncbi:11S globulin precursor [Tanacetum coccineum]
MMHGILRIVVGFLRNVSRVTCLLWKEFQAIILEGYGDTMARLRGRFAYPLDALFSRHWSINNYTIIYVLSSDGQVQVVLNNGEAVLNKQVNRGNISGQNGFEWVTFKPNKSPMKSPVAGYTSVFSTMPPGVLTNAYEISLSQSQNLKNNREIEGFLLSP